MNSLRATDLFTPFVLQLKPSAFPILRIFFMPTNDIRHTFMKIALGGYHLQGFAHNIFNIITYISQRIHGSYKHAAIPAFAIRHDMPHLITNGSRFIGHTWRHDASKIGLNLKVDAMCMRVVLPMATLRSLHALRQIITSHLISVPQRIFFFSESHGKRINRSIQSAAFKYLYESKVYINVIIQAWELIIPFLYRILVPWNRHKILYDRA